MKYQDIHGALREDEAELLRECAELSPNNRFLEIGTFVGKSASVIGEVAKKRNGILMCVDFFADNMVTMSEPKAVIKDSRKTFLANMESCGLLENIICVKGNTLDVLEKINGKFGFAFIDGGHTLKVVLNDAVYAWDSLVEGGFIVFHDYSNDTFPDVRLVITTLMEKWGVKPYKVTDFGNMIAIKKCSKT